MRSLNGKTRLERVLFGELSEAFPQPHEVGGVEQVPMLRRLQLADVPNELIAFDDRKRAVDSTQTALHFFRFDHKFVATLLEPEKRVKDFQSFSAVLTPDVTLGTGMPPWQRARNTVLGRAAGAVWQSRGLTVIPTLRWLDESDYELVASGIPN